MAKGNATELQIIPCLRDEPAAMLLLVSLFAMPGHFVLMKVLVTNCRFDLPRHIIAFSLSLSDVFHLLITFITTLITKILDTADGGEVCNGIQQARRASFIPAVVISSMSIVAMSVERYVACIHSFRLHQIITNTRVTWSLSFVWIVGFVLGIIKVAVYQDNELYLQLILLLSLIPSCIFVTVIQVRLAVFSREKLNRVNPAGAVGEQAELADIQRRQLKVALMAGVVALAYTFCVIPSTFICLTEVVNGKPTEAPMRNLLTAALVANSAVDPFLYGFGIADTRRFIIRDLKRLKQYVLTLIQGY